MNDYEVDGEHFTELAKAENRVREMLQKGYLQIVITKNGKPYSVYYKNKCGNVNYRRFK